MNKTSNIRVVNNRMQFRCASCGAKRNFPVLPNIRIKNMRCHKCGVITRCLLNRRITTRELHSGKVIMLTTEGKEITVNLHDISMNGGFGVDLPIRASRARTVKVGDEVRFNCKWNPRLLGSGRFKVINSNGQRLGIKKVA